MKYWDNSDPCNALILVMDAVMLDTKVEKLSIAITITQTVNVRSTEFCGFTCIVAGVNCVKDQCSETKYCVAMLSLSILYLPLQLPSPTSEAPMSHHKHAIMWFIAIMEPRFLAVLKKMKMISELMWSWSKNSKCLNLRNLSSRNALMILMTRKNLPTRNAPALSAVSSSAEPVASNTATSQSTATMKKSMQNGPDKIYLRRTALHLFSTLPSCVM
mmetsp:Transcript_10032/g.22788  ORF Transcript_10032/g.22788 Transcript_10032/m.22788 type:complete len:216 (+) Transcript_10032:1129-1776(+)